MNKYRLCFEDTYSKSFELELSSSNSIYRLDKLTMKFSDEEELLKYFNINKKNSLFKVLIKNDLGMYPVMYSNNLNYVENVAYLNKKLIEKSSDNNFLHSFIKRYNNKEEIKDYLKIIKKSISNIDKYTYNMVLLSIDKYSYDSIVFLNVFKNIVKGKDMLSKKEIILEHINCEYSKIENNLHKVFNSIIYDGKNINYMNLRDLCLFINNYPDNIISKNTQKRLVKSIKS